MPKRAERPQRPRHILIFDEDWDFLTTHYGPASQNRMGVSPAIRQMVHAYCTKLRARMIQSADAEQSQPEESPDV